MIEPPERTGCTRSGEYDGRLKRPERLVRRQPRRIYVIVPISDVPCLALAEKQISRAYILLPPRVPARRARVQHRGNGIRSERQRRTSTGRAAVTTTLACVPRWLLDRSNQGHLRQPLVPSLSPGQNGDLPKRRPSRRLAQLWAARLNPFWRASSKISRASSRPDQAETPKLLGSPLSQPALLPRARHNRRRDRKQNGRDCPHLAPG